MNNKKIVLLKNKRIQFLISLLCTGWVFSSILFFYNQQTFGKYTIITKTSTIEKKGRGYYYFEESKSKNYKAHGVCREIRYRTRCRTVQNSRICITEKYNPGKYFFIFMTIPPRWEFVKKRVQKRRAK